MRRDVTGDNRRWVLLKGLEKVPGYGSAEPQPQHNGEWSRGNTGVEDLEGSRTVPLGYIKEMRLNWLKVARDTWAGTPFAAPNVRCRRLNSVGG